MGVFCFDVCGGAILTGSYGCCFEPWLYKDVALWMFFEPWLYRSVVS